MAQHQSCLLHSLFCKPYSSFHQCLSVCVLSGSSSIVFKAFPWTISISFITVFFFLYSHGSIPYIRAGIKQASKCYNWALISFRTWFFDPVVSISLLIALHRLSNSSMIPFRFSSLLITIPKYLHVLLLCMFPALLVLFLNQLHLQKKIMKNPLFFCTFIQIHWNQKMIENN